MRAAALALIAAPGLASAAPAVGVQYAALAARFVGDLGVDEPTLAHSVQIEALFVDADDWPLRGYLAIDVFWTGATHRGDVFPYPAGAELDVLGFLFIPHLCWRPAWPVAACGGIGQGTVNVNAPRDRRDWGTWNYQLRVEAEPVEHLSVFALGKYVGQVEQQVAGRDGAFALLMLGGGLGARW